jgi:integrase
VQHSVDRAIYALRNCLIPGFDAGPPGALSGTLSPQHSPTLSRRRSPAGLWAALKRRAITGQAIYDAITQRTRVAFGRAINPHLFRDCAATTIAITAPDRIGVARDLLGHASLATTEQYYNQARSIDASRLLARVLGRRRTVGPRKGGVSCVR